MPSQPADRQVCKADSELGRLSRGLLHLHCAGRGTGIKCAHGEARPGPGSGLMFPGLILPNSLQPTYKPHLWFLLPHIILFISLGFQQVTQHWCAQGSRSQ